MSSIIQVIWSSKTLLESSNRERLSLSGEKEIQENVAIERQREESISWVREIDAEQRKQTRTERSKLQKRRGGTAYLVLGEEVDEEEHEWFQVRKMPKWRKLAYGDGDTEE